MEILVSLSIFALLFSGVVADSNNIVFEEVRVGLVVDLGSIQGKILKTSISLALSDFYRVNNSYRTRVSVLARDSQGDPLLALAAAKDLLQTGKVKAIVGAESLQEAKLLAAISEKAKVPVISTLVPNTLSLNKYNHFIQWTYDITSEAKGITSLIQELNLKSIVVIYEDVDDCREGLQVLVDHFQDGGVYIDRTTSFLESSSEEDYMVYQLRKLKSARAAVFVVHMSEMLVSRLFQCADKLGMIEEGYVWILTARTMNNFHNLDGFAVRSMQGVIGFRSYIPVSEQVMNFTSRLRQLMVDDDTAQIETEHFSVVISVWAHDIACILATAVENIWLRASNESNLLETIKQSGFKGLSHGDMQIVGNKYLLGTFEIVNMVGTWVSRIGLWSCYNLCGRRRVIVSSINELETIIWPGGSGRIPRHRFLEKNSERKLLRVLVTSRNNFPHLVAVRPDPETGLNIVSGFCIEVFKASIAPFNYELEFIPYNRSSNYDDLANELFTQRDKYDAAVGDITITYNRSLYVDFTLPYTEMGVGVLTVKKKKESMWTFFDPLDKSLWLATGAFFILTGFVVWLVERAVNPEFQGSWGQQIGMILWFGFSTIVFAHREKLQKMSSKFVVIVWVFVVLILTSSYSANLTSTKTISRIQYSELLRNPSQYRMLRTNSTLNTFDDYVQALRDGTISYLISEIPYLNVFLGHYPGVFEMLGRDTTSNGFGFMFQKGSGLAPNVSREIVKLRSSRMLKDMEKRWFQELDSFGKPHIDWSENDDAFNRLTIHELGGLFVIVGVSHALVLALHLYQTRRDISRALWESRLFTKLQNFSGFYK
ncbi:Ionotropic glutamate receptor [Arabidopsis suecica]|uniref:Glutamate receptor n=1 Tax=Arabidopsis suecica TaxID=45249 RepID=A0A8T2BSJ8_ARASU|nr:Ionotropic glutamate receptor [Arabidopsis suecica]